MTQSLDLTLEIQQRNGRPLGLLHRSDRSFTETLEDLTMGETTLLKVKGRELTLGALVEALVAYRDEDLAFAFDERGQLEIGAWLYQQLFDDKDFDADQVFLRVQTDSEHIARLPWPLLARNEVFCCANGWSVAVCGAAPLADSGLPPLPRMLLVMPEPSGVAATQAARHREALETLLSAHAPALTLGRQLHLAETWEAFRRECESFRPEVVYYYGHGIAKGLDSTHLVFADEKGQRQDRPVADFAQVLRNLERSPALVYVNCCQGDAGGMLGVGRQLGALVPAVITNRTVATIAAAQGQALALWESLLLKGEPPHSALSTLYARLTGPDLSSADVRWMTPVLHAHYRGWRASPVRTLGREIHDPYWHLKIDRVAQFSIVAQETRRMLREGRPRCRAFVWYGRAGEGVDIFHKRLRVELREDLGNAKFQEVAPRWPDDLADPHRSFSDMLCEAFAVQTLEDIPARIRHDAHGISGRRVLVHVRHQPVSSPELIHPGSLKQYLEWLDQCLLPLLEPQQFLLLGVSFVVGNPPRFRKAVERKGVDGLALRAMAFRLLDELERVALRDLRDFLQTHNIYLPLERRDRVLQEILAQTEGNYEQTVDELKRRVENAWYDEEAAANVPAEAEEYDY